MIHGTGKWCQKHVCCLKHIPGANHPSPVLLLEVTVSGGRRTQDAQMLKLERQLGFRCLELGASLVLLQRELGSMKRTKVAWSPLYLGQQL